MALFAAIFVVIGFAILIEVFNLVELSQKAIAEARVATATLRDPTISDEIKESALQRSTIRLFKFFGGITLSGLGSLVIPLGIVWLVSRTGLFNFDAVIALLERWDFIVAATVIGIGTYILLSRFVTRKQTPAQEHESSLASTQTFENKYSRIDKALHRFAFASVSIQATMSDIEDKIYKEELAGITVEQPVFITALPRAGTTVLLNMLFKTGEFATHTYRNMPFVLSPMLWQKFSQRFFKEDVQMERAHGDGLTVSADSPEAFEEMIWHLFWREHYKTDRIDCWNSCDDAYFKEFLDAHIKKIIALGKNDNPTSLRYISKNNLNIARLAILPKIYPDCRIIVPYREPLQHAASLLNQHLRFLETHAQDPFARRYMEGIGHYDFGDNLRPINFNDWLDGDRRSDAKTIEFWLEYWHATYRHIIDTVDDSVCLLSYTQLTERPKEGLRYLSTLINLAEPVRLIDQFDIIRSPGQHSVGESDVSSGILDECRSLFAGMEKQKLF